MKIDCVSRAEVLKLMQDNWHTHNGDWAMQESMDDIRALPSVTPQEPFINKSCVSSEVCEHDKNRVLDKIRAEVEEYKSRQLTLAISVEDLEEGKQIALEYVLAILDKYKAESEDT